MKNTLFLIVAVMASSSYLVAGSDAAVPLAAPVVMEDDNEDADGLYVGLAYTHMSHDLDNQGAGTFAEVDHHGFMVNLGYKFNPYIAAEGRYQTNVGDEHNNEGDSDNEDFNKDSKITVLSLFVKPMYPLAPEFDIYALLGYSFTDSANKLKSTSLDEGSFSWGGGGSYIITEDFSVFGEYTQFYNDTSNGYDHVVDSFSIGIAYTF